MATDLALAEDLLQVRMVTEYAYCPRLYYLMHAEGLWADNEYTIQGRHVHRRIDQAIDGILEPVPAGPLEEGASEERQDPVGDEPPQVARSVKLGSPTLGITGRLDLVATEGGEAVPVETKRGRVPDNPQRSWEPERVQLMAQGLLLREHGYRTLKGVLYFAGSRTRVDVPFTADLEARTLRLIAEARQAGMGQTSPPPLVDSPKCVGCSLSGICLPDETNLLRAVPPAEGAGSHGARRLYPLNPDAGPLYVQEPGATVGKNDERLIVRKDGRELSSVGLKDIDELILCGNVSISASAIHLLCEAGIPIVHLSGGHWFYGLTTGTALRNAYDRAAQFAAAGDPGRCLAIARAIVTAKGINQRVMLRRNAEDLPGRELDRMHAVIQSAANAQERDELLGIEGNVARIYFENFGRMLRPRSSSLEFEFEGRNRRPPRDPVNALLSFAYALLVKECTVALQGVGLDPFWGLYHQPRHGRPALALDLMEEFRPVVADSAVITAINNGIVERSDFVIGANACSLKPPGRKKFIQAYAARLEQLVTHPVFDYRCSWRQVLRLQARLLARHLRGELGEYRGMTTR